MNHQLERIQMPIGKVQYHDNQHTVPRYVVNTMENAHSNRISQPEHGTPNVRALTSPALGGMVHAQNTTAKTYAQQLYANAMNPQSKDNSQNSVLRVDPVSVYQGKSSISYSPPSTRPVPSIVSNGTRPLDVVKGFSNGSSRYPTNQAGQTTGASVGAIGQGPYATTSSRLQQHAAAFSTTSRMPQTAPMSNPVPFAGIGSYYASKRVAETQPSYSSPPSMLGGANRISLSQQLSQLQHQPLNAATRSPPHQTPPQPYQNNGGSPPEAPRPSHARTQASPVSPDHPSRTVSMYSMASATSWQDRSNLSNPSGVWTPPPPQQAANVNSPGHPPNNHARIQSSPVISDQFSRMSMYSTVSTASQDQTNHSAGTTSSLSKSSPTVPTRSRRNVLKKPQGAPFVPAELYAIAQEPEPIPTSSVQDDFDPATLYSQHSDSPWSSRPASTVPTTAPDTIPQNIPSYQVQTPLYPQQPNFPPRSSRPPNPVPTTPEETQTSPYNTPAPQIQTHVSNEPPSYAASVASSGSRNPPSDSKAASTYGLSQPSYPGALKVANPTSYEVNAVVQNLPQQDTYNYSEYPPDVPPLKVVNPMPYEVNPAGLSQPPDPYGAYSDYPPTAPEPRMKAMGRMPPYEVNSASFTQPSIQGAYVHPEYPPAAPPTTALNPAPYGVATESAPGPVPQGPAQEKSRAAKSQPRKLKKANNAAGPAKSGVVREGLVPSPIPSAASLDQGSSGYLRNIPITLPHNAATPQTRLPAASPDVHMGQPRHPSLPPSQPMASFASTSTSYGHPQLDTLSRMNPPPHYHAR